MRTDGAPRRQGPFRLASRWLVPALCLGLVPLAAAAGDARPTVKVPVVKVAPERLFAGSGGEASRAAAQGRLEVLEERFHAVHGLLEGSHVSRRPGARATSAAKDGAPTTLRVLLVRIGFEADRSGELTSVTTDGNFALAPDPDAIFDRPPHDKAYFEAHLTGLGEYYRIQSGGRLAIEGRVLPEGDQDCYRLSDLADYGPGADAGWTLELLEDLVHDVIGAADAGTQQDGSANLADYDDDNELAYVIFVHAGGDWQSDINRDSPNDIPTFFVTLGEPVPLLGADSVTGAPGQISECSIIPESTSQDGWLGSIAGALYHEFGHALGLPDVYDTTTGLPAVGLWDLMDSGPNLVANVGLNVHPEYPDSIDVFSVAGLLPPSLGAWNRWYLGWLETATIGGGDREVHLPASQIPRSQYVQHYGGSSVGGAPYDFDLGYPQAILGGVSPREFFLVENRWVPLSGDELPDETGIGFVRDAATGVFLYMGGDLEDPDGPGPLEEASRNTGMYDFFLPDGGLLVWHVNEARIEEQLADNTINGEGDGLRLLEADGIQDVGVYDAYVFGFYGSARDPFHAGTTASLRQEGRPSSRTYERAWTGFEMLDISAQGATMTFTARTLPLRAGDPLRLPAAADPAVARRLDPESVTPWLVDGIGGPAAAPALACASLPVDAVTEGAADEPAYLFLFDAEGRPAAQGAPGWPAGAAAALTAPLAGPPAVVHFETNDRDLLVVGERSGHVSAYLDLVAGGSWLRLWGPLAVADTLAYAPAVGRLPGGEARLLCCTEPGRALLLDEQGARVGEPIALDDLAGEGVAAVLAAPRVVTAPFGVDRFLLLTDDRWYLIPVEGLAEGGASTGRLGLAPAADGYRVAVLEDGVTARVVVFGRDGAAVSVVFAPHLAPETAPWPLPQRGAPAGEPAVADLDGDGHDDVVLATATHLVACAADGAPLAGFPLELAAQFPFAAPTAFDGSLAVFDVDGDGRNEVLAATDGGHLLAWDATGRLLPRAPLLWGDAGGAALVAGDDPGLGRVLWLADSGGRQAPGLGGTPVTGSAVGWLPVAATRDAEGTSCWLGPLGGPRRDGRVGEPRDLGALSTQLAERDRFLAYPNPLRGREVAFRYWSGRAGEARLSVLNLEGESVAELRHVGGEGTVEEIRWSPDALSSGVYLVRLTAPAVEGNVTRLLRLAVER
ncbi:MAG: immune inhibitor A [bacterium]|nr:immune inhibitor A [bacterium]